MDGPGGQFLARTRLTLYKHGHVALSRDFHQPEHVLHDVTLPDEFSQTVAVSGLLLQEKRTFLDPGVHPGVDNRNGHKVPERRQKGAVFFGKQILKLPVVHVERAYNARFRVP